MFYLIQWGKTALITAVENSYIEVMRLLLELGANVEANDKVRKKMCAYMRMLLRLCFICLY